MCKRAGVLSVLSILVTFGCAGGSADRSSISDSELEASQPTLIYSNLPYYEAEVDSAVWTGGVIRICETTSQSFCAFMAPLKADNNFALTDGKQGVALFASTKESVPDSFPYELTKVEPVTLQKLKDQWNGIQITCSVTAAIGCGIIGISNPAVGAVCGVGAAFVCTRSPEFFGVESCHFFEPQPGTDRSLKLTPASAGAVASQKCQTIASKTISSSALSSAQAGCMLSIDTGMASDSCAMFPGNCFFVQEVQHQSGTEIPESCRRIVR